MSVLLLLLCCAGLVTPLSASTRRRRGRGEGFYMCESANTAGSGNIWLDSRAIGFLWDDDPESNEQKILGFLEARASMGLFNVTSLFVETRPVSYPWDRRPQFGFVGGGLKCTLPTNRDLRTLGPGLLLRYRHTLTQNIPSIAGYRQEGSATGFSAEGFMCEGGQVELKALFDVDLLARVSFLPIKVMTNIGVRLPVDKELRTFSRYLLQAGVAYVGLTFDAYVEYAFEGFVNEGVQPKVFEKELGLRHRTWEVAFSENPMYVTVGGRARYPGGLTLHACVPLLLSRNRGSDINDKDPKDLPADEKRRGVTSPFDPWYARWKVIVGVAVPVRFKQTAAEMRRNFLLMKNRSGQTKIDLEEKLREDEHDGTDGEEERQRRLEEIRRKRERIQEGR
jgi:hypothetical protein